MINSDLVKDYVRRGSVRLKGLQLYFDEKSWADVVRESQEVVELCSKALLRFHLVDPPRIHDVAKDLLLLIEKIPSEKEALETLARASRTLRRDRELAFYGSEDLTPSEFYSQDDALRAKDDAGKAVELVARLVGYSG